MWGAVKPPPCCSIPWLRGDYVMFSVAMVEECVSPTLTVSAHLGWCCWGCSKVDPP